MILRFKILLATTFLTLSLNPVFSEENPRQALEAFADNVQYTTLSNGLRVIMYKRGVAPVFSGVVAVRVGGTDEKPGITGISHMFEHMAFKGTSKVGTKDYEREKILLNRLEELVSQASGTENFTPQQKKEWDEINEELTKNIWTTETFTREYEKQGASGMNATTDTEVTRYFVSLPRTSFEFWCAFESARLIDPVIRQFYQERDVVMEERRMRNDNSPDGRLYESLIDVAYKVHPYRFPVIGYERDVKSITATEVSEFRKKYYVPSNIVLSLVGDVELGRDRAMLEKYFGRIPVGPNPPRPTEIEPKQESMRQVSVKFPASPITFLAYHKPIFPDLEDAPISLFMEILAGSSVSPLYEELVKKRQIVTSVESDEGPGYAYPNLAIFGLNPRAPYTNNDAIAGFDSVLEKILKSGVTEEQLLIAKRAMAVEMLTKLKSNLSLAIDLVSSELLHGSWRVIIDWYDQVMRLTPEDINKVARKYFVKNNRVIARLEKSSKGERGVH